LKLAATAATSSRPEASTRWPSAPAPHHRVGADGDRGEQQDQDRGQPGTTQPGRQPAHVGRRVVGSVAHAAHASGPFAARHAQHPQRAPVVQGYRQAPRCGGGQFRGTAQEGFAGTDALARGVVQRQRQAQTLRPVGERSGLLFTRCFGRRQ
jgi:hypothetical protein